MVDEDIGAERSRPEVADGGGPVFFIAESPMNCLLQRPRRVAKRAGGGEVRRTDSVSRDAASSSIGIFPAALSSFYFPLIAEPQLPPLPSLFSLSLFIQERSRSPNKNSTRTNNNSSFLPSFRPSGLPSFPFSLSLSSHPSRSLFLPSSASCLSSSSTGEGLFTFFPLSSFRSIILRRPAFPQSGGGGSSFLASRAVAAVKPNRESARPTKRKREVGGLGGEGETLLSNHFKVQQSWPKM